VPTAAVAAVDAFVVLLFVLIGRRSHEEGEALRDLFAVAAPFLIGLAAGWLLATRWWRGPAQVVSVRFGVVVWLVTVAAGMVLRHWVFDRGTALSFVIVATTFLGLFLVGWRGLAGVIRRRTPVTHRGAGV